ncbi:hypothetical Protein YC6258_05670 [Gynuella sunshinyii YC6258]|uniref:Uncharacterized protein n=1 Tax=Gynuella sunshinyii YC6258 TaxID=1445510 RepID=A0A0C5VSP2_9GAMM|nr:hypothetical Protein YC6258_05670 [Gynuella sunshinyii YC6258]
MVDISDQALAKQPLKTAMPVCKMGEKGVSSWSSLNIHMMPDTHYGTRPARPLLVDTV